MSKAVFLKIEGYIKGYRYDLLHDIDQGAELDALTDSDKELLALLCVKSAAQQMESGEVNVMAFDCAHRLTPNNIEVYLKQGEAYLEKSSDSSSLLKAEQCFSRGLSLNKFSFIAHYLHGKSLSLRATLDSDNKTLCLKAEESFLRAEELLPSDDRYRSMLSVSRGDLCLCNAASSGELSDYNKALSYYTIAEDSGFGEFEFLVNYAFVCGEVGHRLNQLDFIEKGIALINDIDSAPLELARLFYFKYKFTKKENAFMGAHKACSKAVKQGDSLYDAYELWSKLLMLGGEVQGDNKRLQLCIVKLDVSLKEFGEAPFLYYLKAKAFLSLGKLKESVAFLRSAEFFILKALGMLDSSGLFWALYADILNAFADYFDDSSYRLEALKKIEYGLARAENSGEILVSQGITYLALGVNEERSFLERALDCFASSSKYGADGAIMYNYWGSALLRYSKLEGNSEYIYEALQKFELMLRNEGSAFVKIFMFDNAAEAYDYAGEVFGDKRLCEKAVELLRHSIEQNPSVPRTYYRLAQTIIHYADITGDLNFYYKAMEFFERALKFNDEDESIWNAWGKLLLRLSFLVGTMDGYAVLIALRTSALEKLMRAASLGYRPALYSLAQIHAINNSVEDSICYLRKSHQQKALPTLEVLLKDEHLLNILSSDEFLDFITEIKR